MHACSKTRIRACDGHSRGIAGWASGQKRANIHEQASLAASTVADDDKLPADLSHCGLVSVGLVSGWTWSSVERAGT